MVYSLLIDDNGDEIDISKLDVDSQYQSIAVTVDVLSTKEVPIKCTTTGSPGRRKERARSRTIRGVCKCSRVMQKH